MPRIAHHSLPKPTRIPQPQRLADASAELPRTQPKSAQSPIISTANPDNRPVELGDTEIATAGAGLPAVLDSDVVGKESGGWAAFVDHGMTWAKQRKVVVNVLNWMTVQEAAEDAGVTGAQLFVARRKSPAFAAVLEEAMNEAAEDRLHGLGIKGNQALIKAWVVNRMSNRWKPDDAIAQTTKDDLTRHAGGRPGSINIRQIIVHPPQSLPSGRTEVIELQRALPSTDTVEGEVVDANTTNALREASSFSETSLDEAHPTTQSDDDVPANR